MKGVVRSSCGAALVFVDETAEARLASHRAGRGLNSGGRVEWREVEASPTNDTLQDRIADLSRRTLFFPVEVVDIGQVSCGSSLLVEREDRPVAGDTA